MPDFLSALVTAGAGLLGVGLGSTLALFNQRRHRADERVQQQLTEFYGPFLGLIKLKDAKSEFRVKLSGTLGEAWPRLFAGPRAQGDPELLKKTSEENWPAFAKAQDYADHVLEYEIIPLYNKMVQLFADKMSLTEPSTRSHLKALVEYVEIWNRFYADALPKAALPLLDHREEKVKPLYGDVANQVESLTRQISSRRANIRRGLHRLSIVFALSWLIGASVYLWTTMREPTFACSESPSQGILTLSPSGAPASNGVHVQGPDGQMYLFPEATTKSDAVSYFKQRCTHQSKTLRSMLLFAAVPASVGYLLLIAAALVGSWVWRGFWNHDLH